MIHFGCSRVACITIVSFALRPQPWIVIYIAGISGERLPRGAVRRVTQILRGYQLIPSFPKCLISYARGCCWSAICKQFLNVFDVYVVRTRSSLRAVTLCELSAVKNLYEYLSSFELVRNSNPRACEHRRRLLDAPLNRSVGSHNTPERRLMKRIVCPAAIIFSSYMYPGKIITV